MEDTKNGFIDQTAHDYDMRYEEVEKIYNLYYPIKFYEKLEEHIKNKKDN